VGDDFFDFCVYLCCMAFQGFLSQQDFCDRNVCNKLADFYRGTSNKMYEAMFGSSINSGIRKQHGQYLCPCWIITSKF